MRRVTIFNIVQLRWFIFVLSTLLLLTSMQTTAQTLSQDKIFIQQAVDKMVEDKILVGVAIGLYDKGETTHIYSGYRTAHQAYPINDSTRFEIGSVTKTFVGILLADAHLNKSLDMKTPISKLLPQLSNQDKLSDINLRQLSTHSSGLPRLPSNIRPASVNDPYLDYTSDDLYQFLSEYDDYQKTDNEVVYSNLAVGLLGHLLALNAGTNFETLLEQTILSPLDMKHTYVATPSAELLELALPHSNDMKAVKPWRFDVLAPAGAISSTLPDMMKYLVANIKAEQMDEIELKKSIELAQQANFPFSNDDVSMGLGWLESDRSAGKVIWHNGGTAGSASFLGFNPSSQKGVVVLMNVSAQATEAGFAYLDGKIKSHLSRYTAPVKQIVTADDLSNLVGNYELTPNFVLSVTQREDRLFVQATGQANIEVFPKTKTRFYYKVVDAEIEFALNSDGSAKSLTLFQNGQELIGEKK